MNIRKAQKEDAPKILLLMKELIDEHHSWDSYYKSFEKFKGLKGHIIDSIRDPQKLVLVSEDAEKIIGYLIAEIEKSPFYSTEDKIGVIVDTVVTKKYRQRGMLKKFFEEALKWFKKNGINVIELSVDIRNKNALAAWKQLGFEEYKLRMKRYT